MTPIGVLLQLPPPSACAVSEKPTIHLLWVRRPLYQDHAVTSQNRANARGEILGVILILYAVIFDTVCDSGPTALVRARDANQLSGGAGGVRKFN